MNAKKTNSKLRYKLYKSGKLWITAATIVLGLTTTSITVNADANNQSTIANSTSVSDKTAHDDLLQHSGNVSTAPTPASEISNSGASSAQGQNSAVSKVEVASNDKSEQNSTFSNSNIGLPSAESASSTATSANPVSSANRNASQATSVSDTVKVQNSQQVQSANSEDSRLNSTDAVYAGATISSNHFSDATNQQSEASKVFSTATNKQNSATPQIADSINSAQTNLKSGLSVGDSTTSQTNNSDQSQAAESNVNEENASLLSGQHALPDEQSDNTEYKFIYTSPTSRYRIAAAYETPRNVWNWNHSSYFDGNGQLVSGLQFINNTWYYFDNNSHNTVNGYVQLGWGGYLFGGNDNRIQTGFRNVSGSWYYFDDNNFLKVNYGYINGRLFAGSDGRAMSGLQYAYNNWYYFDSNSLLRTSGYVQLPWGGYMFSDGGSIETGLVNAYGSWYYFNPNNFLRTSGYVQLPWGGYMFSNGGTIQTGLVNAYGSWYYFNPYNFLKTSGYIQMAWGGYMFGNDGAIQTGLVNAYGSTWYFDPITYVKRANAVVNVNNQLYYLAGNGQVIDNGIDWSNNYGYYAGQCTAYVAKRLAQHGVAPYWYGNGAEWVYHAAGVTYNAPAVGMVAWSTAGGYGHVAYVEAVYGNLVKVSEANFNGLPYHERWVRIGDGSFNGFLTFI